LTTDGHSGGGGRRAKILIVDDEVDITSTLKLALERRGFLVETYNDPTDLLLSPKAEGYDLAIFDIRMPKMTGFELYRKFREIDGHVGICFMTAFDIHANEFKTVFPDVQPVGFFRKPISIEELVGKIDKLLDSAGRGPAQDQKVRA
jgi:two-component system, OmpR family, response regulator ChvI